MQVEVIKEKITQAPDKANEIGVFIGTYLPFVVLVILAYGLFYYFKNKKDE